MMKVSYIAEIWLLVAPDKSEYSKRILRITSTITNDNFIKRPFF